jgi:hypothetical protein
MIKRVLQLKDVNFSYIFLTFLLKKLQAVDEITGDPDFEDLHKFSLSEEDWNLLEDYREILGVILFVFF